MRLTLLLLTVCGASYGRVRRQSEANLKPDDRLNCDDGDPNPAIRINTSERLSRLRDELRREQISAYIIPSDDEHQSEYVAEYDRRVKYISGFSGSAGLAVVTLNSAALWTDGRYFLQADNQLDCNWLLMRQQLALTPSKTDWLKSQLRNADRVAADGRLIGADEWTEMDKALRESNIILQQLSPNLVDRVWTSGRPPRSPEPPFVLPLKYSGEPWSSKVQRVRNVLKSLEAEVMIVTAMDEVAWLFNLRGSDIPYNPVFRSYAIIDKENIHLYIPREKVVDELLDHLHSSNCNTRDCVRIHDYDSVLTDLRQMTLTWRDKVLVPSKYAYSGGASYAIYAAISEDKRLFVPSPIAKMKGKKNGVEVEGMRKAHLRDSAALVDFLAFLEKEIDAGKRWDEISAAKKLRTYRAAQKNFVDLSFGTISAFGSNGAVIHYSPRPETNKTIDKSSLYLLDSGGQYFDGTTDVTRTMHYGTPTDLEREAYTRVLMGVIDLASLTFPSGVTDTRVDILARRHLFNIGLNYRHGTGHGIGAFLNIHESPIQVRVYAKEEHEFEVNQYFSDEPGFYKDGDFGIRLETILRVINKTTKYHFDGTYLGFEPVTLVPFERKLIKLELMSADQRSWLDEYHQRVRNEVGAELRRQKRYDGEAWLQKMTAPFSLTHPSSASSNQVFLPAVVVMLVVAVGGGMTTGVVW